MRAEYWNVEQLLQRQRQGGAPTTTTVLCIAEKNFARRQEPFAKENVPRQTRSCKPFFDMCSAVQPSGNPTGGRQQVRFAPFWTVLRHFEPFSAGLEPFWAVLDRFGLVSSPSGPVWAVLGWSSPLGTPGGTPQEVPAKCLGLGSLPLTLKGSTAFTACAKRHALPRRAAAPA